MAFTSVRAVKARGGGTVYIGHCNICGQDTRATYGRANAQANITTHVKKKHATPPKGLKVLRSKLSTRK